MAADRMISCPGATDVSSCDMSSLCSCAPPRYTNSTLPASHVAVPLFLTFQPAPNFSPGRKLALLLGDCQINLQLSSLGMVAAGDGVKVDVGPGRCQTGLAQQVELRWKWE
jgi:hypothetical protein